MTHSLIFVQKIEIAVEAIYGVIISGLIGLSSTPP